MTLLIFRLTVFIFVIYCAFHLNDIHDWICTKLSNLSLTIFRR